MDWAEISRLAVLLRERGDKILNEQCKFTLSTKLLSDLNGSFNLLSEQRDHMSSSFSILSNTNLNVEIFRDVQFLHDFVQRSLSLKLVHNYAQPIPNEIINIKKFWNLKYLELDKVKCCNVLGMQVLRAQLQYLTCIRSISEVGEVLEKCGADLSQGSVWNELKGAVFTHNNLECIDSSFEFAPWLHTLDLSHNEIQDIRPLNCLYNLKYLNLGFNKITTIPTFSGQICSRLQVLILCHNFIEDITGLIVLINVRELDLSHNCLMQHNLLTPLANLATLQYLNLESNPIYYHVEHRMLTSYNLHRNTATVRFVLDREVMKKKELKYVGSLHPIQAKKPALGTSCSSSSVNTTLVERSRRTREAVIADEEQKVDLDESLASISSLVTSSDHLETRRQIEELREKFGSTWLYKEGGSLVQEVLGMPKSSFPKTSSPYDADFLIHAGEVLEARALEGKTPDNSPINKPEIKRIDNRSLQCKNDSTLLSTSRKSNKTEAVVETASNSLGIDENKTDSDKESSRKNDNEEKQNDNDDNEEDEKFQSLNTLDQQVDQASAQTTTYESATEQLSGEEEDHDCLYPDENASVASTQSLFDLGKGDDGIFIVTVRGTRDPLFLIVSDKFMAERDAIVNAREKTKWDTDTLMSCELIDDEPPFVQLKFDTLRSDRKIREYCFDDVDEMQRLIGVLKDIVDSRPPDKLTCFKCMKCSTTFGTPKVSTEKAKRMYEEKAVECPNCFSNLVIEEDD